MIDKGQCRKCGGVFRLADNGMFMRAHGRQRNRCRGWKLAPVAGALPPRRNVLNHFSAIAKV